MADWSWESTRNSSAAVTCLRKSGNCSTLWLSDRPAVLSASSNTNITGRLHVRNPMTPERLPTSYTFHVLTVISKHVVINLHRAQLPVGKGRHDIIIIMYVSGLITWNHWTDFASWSSYKQRRNIKRLLRGKRVSITKNRLMAFGWKLLDDFKFYSHQLMHFFIQLCISLLSYIKKVRMKKCMSWCE